MSECVYDDMIYIEELKRGERMEMVVDIYENADAVKSHNPSAQTEETGTKRNFQTHHTGWRFFSSSLYYVSTERRHLTESRKDCIERGAVLVFINSKEEQKFIKQLHGHGLWIGLSDMKREGMWNWVDGTPLTTQYSRRGEPNSNGDEDCAVITYLDRVENWADCPCDRAFTWICEREIVN